MEITESGRKAADDLVSRVLYQDTHERYKHAGARKRELYQTEAGVEYIRTNELLSCEMLSFSVQISMMNMGHMDGSNVVMLIESKVFDLPLRERRLQLRPVPKTEHQVHKIERRVRELALFLFANSSMEFYELSNYAAHSTYYLHHVRSMFKGPTGEKHFMVPAATGIW
ncbi:hypothetical protein Cgig2_032819 [Carnegiea gigantea]|uniref:Uncharacterized protein n=1 Tax=Carnegiea gigantea TaxID=171969 RepID=A0A9Q1JIL8_9CARY|nr:hypothetical protein Cgig2_032819 [Carnegiea gigantea]